MLYQVLYVIFGKTIIISGQGSDVFWKQSRRLHISPEVFK